MAERILYVLTNVDRPFIRPYDPVRDTCLLRRFHDLRSHPIMKMQLRAVASSEGHYGPGPAAVVFITIHPRGRRKYFAIFKRADFAKVPLLTLTPHGIRFLHFSPPTPLHSNSSAVCTPTSIRRSSDTFPRLLRSANLTIQAILGASRLRGPPKSSQRIAPSPIAGNNGSRDDTANRTPEGNRSP